MEAKAKLMLCVFWAVGHILSCAVLCCAMSYACCVVWYHAVVQSLCTVQGVSHNHQQVLVWQSTDMLPAALPPTLLHVHVPKHHNK